MIEFLFKQKEIREIFCIVHLKGFGEGYDYATFLFLVTNCILFFLFLLHFFTSLLDMWFWGMMMMMRKSNDG